jgi:7-cyano-7-deazaguanine synthase
MADAISQGFWANKQQIKIHTPLMNLSKKDSVILAAEALGDRFSEVFALTHTCYDGTRGGCGRCHACILRDKGFKDAGIDDPLWAIRQTYNAIPYGVPV